MTRQTMTRSHRRFFAGIAMLAAVLTACSGSSPEPVAKASVSASPSRSAQGSTKPSTNAPKKTSPATHAPATKGSSIPSPRPLKMPFEPDPSVPITAAVSPNCVSPGDKIALTVDTEPKAGVAYIAVYSDNKTGAGQGFGADYGGNDGGEADANGSYASSWTVSSRAPLGMARVDLFVTNEQGRQNHGTADFLVAAPGSC
jgi:hypothetical protein